MSVAYVFSAYSSRAARLGYGLLSTYCSRALMSRSSQNLSDDTIVGSENFQGDLRFHATARYELVEGICERRADARMFSPWRLKGVDNLFICVIP